MSYLPIPRPIAPHARTHAPDRIRRRTAQLAAAAVQIISGLLLASWLVGAPPEWLPRASDLLPQADSALALLLLSSAAQIMAQPRAARWLRALAPLLATATLPLAGSALWLAMSGHASGLNMLLVPHSAQQASSFSPRMAEASAVGFLALGGALLVRRSRSAFTIGALFALLVFGQGLLSYLYDIRTLDITTGRQQMSLLTALLGILGVVSVTATHPMHNLADPAQARGSGATLLRWLLLPSLLLPIGIGGICLAGLRAGMLDGERAILLLVVTTIGCLWALTLRSSIALDQLDQVRGQAEHALRESEQRLQAILDSASTIIYLKDMHGRFLLVNRQFYRLFHLTPADVLGKTDFDLFPAALAAAYQRHDQHVFQTGENYEVEEQSMQDDGMHTYQSIKFALRDQRGQMYAICGISSDITSRKHSEAQQQQLQAERQGLLEQAQEAIRERDAFMSITAHEIRTPLTSIVGFAEMVQRRMVRNEPSTERDLRALEVIYEESQRLTLLINDLLEVARGSADQIVRHPVPFDLVALLAKLVETVQIPLAQHTISFTRPTATCMMVGDPLRIEQVFRNLLQNAIKYSPQGGTVRVTLTQNAQEIWVAISDQGLGIPAEALPLLFRRFYRVPGTEAIQGSGIGLYLVKTIVTAHGGSIQVTSTPGHGSTFTVCLPGAPADAMAQAAE